MATKTEDPRYNEEARSRAELLYGQLGTVRAVASEMGVSVSRAWVYLNDAGVRMSPPGRRRDP